MPNPDAVYDVLVKMAGANRAHLPSFRRAFRSGEAWHFGRLRYVPRRGRVETIMGHAMYVKHDEDRANRTNASLAAMEDSDADNA